jgi:hypothetical protein
MLDKYLNYIQEGYLLSDKTISGYWGDVLSCFKDGKLKYHQEFKYEVATLQDKI